jgi:predicted outer membrane repeat protein/parallel beta-helix repeat protein
MSIVRESRRGGRSHHQGKQLHKAVIEALESRILLSTYSVSNLHDVASSNSDYTGSLRWAINQVNSAGGNNTIDFASGLSGSIDLTQGTLSINDPSGTVTINGPGAGELTINAEGHSGAFTIGQYATAVISGLTITGGYAQNGAAFNVGGSPGDGGGNLTLSDCTLTGNTATGAGGGIFAGQGTTLSVSYCTISGNSATSEVGGGIEAYGNYFTLANSIVQDNTADHCGGGVFITNCNTTITNCTITGNSARSGGGLYNYQSTTTVENSTITGNSAQRGGGIFNYSVSLYLMNSSVSGNTSDNVHGDVSLMVNTASDDPVGSDTLSLRQAIAQADTMASTYNTNVYIAFDSTVFSSPTTINLTDGPLNIDNAQGQQVTINGPGAGELTINADGHSGAFTIGQYATAVISGLTITGGYAQNGAAINVGGSSDDGGGNLTLTDCTLTGNTATRAGGAIYAGQSTTLSVSYCTISGNSVTGYCGGGIEAYGNYFTLTNSIVENNTAHHSGGGVFITNCNSTVNDCTISGNSAHNGGGLYTYQSSTTVENSTITGNSARFGAGVTNYDGNLLLVNSTLYANTASTRGGGLYISNADNTRVIDCTISGNSAPSTDAGGAFLNSGYVYLSGSIIAGNSGGDCAGNAFTNGTYNLIGDGSGGLPTAPSAHNILGSPSDPINPLLLPLGDYGGPTDTMALLPDSPAIGAGASFDGPDDAPLTGDQRGMSRPNSSDESYDIGAFQSDPLTVDTWADGSVGSGLLSLRQAINLANALGGNQTITVNTIGTINLTQGELSINDPSGTVTINGPGAGELTINADGHSGAFTIGQYATAVISGLTITGGYAQNGAAINVGGSSDDGGGNLTLTDCTLTGNTATRAGGAIYAGQSTTLSVSYCTISGNSVTGYCGGGIEAYGNYFTLTNSIVENNTAHHSGGGVFITNCNSTVNDCTISGNSAHNGGGLYTYQSSTTVENSTITGNSARFGAGVTNYDGNLLLVNSTLYANTASTRGGGLYISNADNTRVIDCTISGNSAPSTDAGGAFLNSGYVYLSGSIIAGNSGGDCAGNAFTNGTYNLIGDGSGGLPTATSDHNILGTSSDPINADLGPLANNGGPTAGVDAGQTVQTMAELEGSPAQGASTIFNDPSGNPITTDERGYQRPSYAADIGAFQSYNVQWTDRRPIYMDVMGNQPFLVGTSAYSMDSITFAQDLFASAVRSIQYMESSGAQGSIVWDMEGYPTGGGTYVGDPNLLTTMLPDYGDAIPSASNFSSTVQSYMVSLPSGSTIVDEYFAMIEHAGFETGMTVRGENISLVGTVNGSEGVAHNGGDSAQNLISRIQYAHDNWGCTLFYIDSYLDGGDELAQVLAACPYALLVPEYAYGYSNGEPNYPYSAPFQQLPDVGDSTMTYAEISTPSYARAVFPAAFSSIRDGNANGGVTIGTQDLPALSQTIENGDLFLYELNSGDDIIQTAYQGLAFNDALYASSDTTTPLNNDVITLTAGPDGLYEISRDGFTIYSGEISGSPELNFDFAGTNDTLVIDTSNGNPIPSAGISFNGGSDSNGNTLEIVGSTGSESITFGNGSVSIGSTTVSFENVANLQFVSKGSSNTLTVSNGVVAIPAQNPGAGVLLQQFSGISVASGATLMVLTAPSRSDMTHVITDSLNVDGTLDLGGNELIVDYGTGTDPIATVQSWLASGYNGGAWNGTGIDSSDAAINSDFALGYADGADGVVTGLPAGEIEILYTLYGDATLSGQVNSADQTIQQSNLSQTGLAWDQGDFTYNGTDNSTDTALLDDNLGHSA